MTSATSGCLVTILCIDELLTLQVLETKIGKFANRVDLDEVAHNEPPHLDLNCFPVWL